MEDDIPIAPSLYSLSNKMDNSLLAVRDINHKHIVVELERLFFQSGRSTVLIKTAENCAKGIKLAIIKGGETDAGLYVLADFKGGLEIRVSGQEESKMVQ